MALGDVPHIGSSSYSTTTVPLAAMNMGFAGLSQAQNQQIFNPDPRIAFRQHVTLPPETEPPMAATRRLVKVVIVDPNENIPLDQCLLYSGEEKLTDATDQELFFEIDIKDILAKHNEKRGKIVDKKVKERVEYLEPAKIRDLKMVVVNVASF